MANIFRLAIVATFLAAFMWQAMDTVRVQDEESYRYEKIKSVLLLLITIGIWWLLFFPL